MRTRTILLSALTIAGMALFSLSGCGGSSHLAGAGGRGDLIIAVNWGNSRVIPPEAVRIDVSVSGEGLSEPVTASIARPESQTVIRNLPVGAKQVVGEAKDSAGRVVARGTGNTRIEEGARASVRIVMSTVPPPAGRVIVRTTRDGIPANATLVVYQDGNGAWQTASGVGGEYTLEITDPAGRYGVAVLCTDGGSPWMRIIHATRSEMDQLSVECPSSAAPVTVSGSISGLDEGSDAIVSLGSGSAFWDRLSRTYRLDVPQGTYDLVALTAPMMFSLEFERMFIRRNVSALTNITENIDFASAEAFTPERRTATISGGPADTVNLTFLANGKTAASVGGPVYGMGSVSFSCAPLSRQQEGDIHLFTAGTFGRKVLRFFKAPTDLNLSLPTEEFSSPEVEMVASSPYVRLRASWSPYPGAQVYQLDFFAQSNRSARSRQGSGRVQWTVYLTPGWLGSSNTYTLPDLSGLTDWNNSWGIPAGVRIDWTAAALSTNRTLVQLFPSLVSERRLDGLEIRQASKSDFLAP
ncbi:MAG: hypothetical protein NZ520_11205 [bacterium]|nr:hypothetical protein [bacterium]